MHITTESIIVFQQDCELIKWDEADYKDWQLMFPNLCVININEKTYSIPIFDLKRPRKHPHHTAYKLVQVNYTYN